MEKVSLTVAKLLLLSMFISQSYCMNYLFCEVLTACRSSYSDNGERSSILERRCRSEEPFFHRNGGRTHEYRSAHCTARSCHYDRTARRQEGEILKKCTPESACCPGYYWGSRLFLITICRTPDKLLGNTIFSLTKVEKH